MNKKLGCYMSTLAVVKRFNRFKHPSNRRQNYATHGYNSLGISSIIGHKHNQDNPDNLVNMEVVYGKLIFGSLHPTFFGDVPKSIQQQYPDLGQAFKLAKQTNGEQLVLDFSPKYRDMFRSYIVHTNDGSMEAEIVSQSENFSVLMKCEEELKALNIRSFKKLKSTIRSQIMDGLKVNLPEELIEEFQDEIYDDFKQLTFIDVYVDTIKTIQNSPSLSVHWYFKEVYFTPFTLILSNMCEVIRWNNADCTTEDTDSEHSFFVAMWGFIFGLIERIEYGQKVDIARIVSKAIFHDIHESLTSDILSYIKRVNEHVKSLIDKMEDDKNYIILALLPEELRDTFEDYMCDPKSDDIEGHLLHIADKVDASVAALKETKRRNSTYFAEAYDDCIRAIMREANHYNCVKDFFTYMLHEFQTMKS